MTADPTPLPAGNLKLIAARMRVKLFEDMAKNECYPLVCTGVPLDGGTPGRAFVWVNPNAPMQQLILLLRNAADKLEQGSATPAENATGAESSLGEDPTP